MSRWRWVVQAALLALFLFGSQAIWVEFDLLALFVGVGSRSIFPPHVLRCLLLVVIVAVVGRFFCGWFCPLGTTIDFAHRYVHPPKSARPDDLRPRARWKYLILAVILAASAVGATTGLVLDPIVLFIRTRELALAPAAEWLGYGSVRILRLLPDNSSFSYAPWETPRLFGYMTVTVLVFGAIIALERIERRFWCRNLCPLGALLNILSRWALIRRSVGGACTSCARCERDCPMGAIPSEDFTQTRTGECIQCLRCQRVCARQSVRFGLKRGNAVPAFDPQRRHVLSAVGAGVGLGMLGNASSHAAPRPANLIRPPGSLPEDEFLSRCTRCLVCVDSCPTNALQPTGIEGGWEGLWTPKLVPTIGGCEEPCFACTQICPTYAIRPLSHEEKSFAKIGTARVLKERCVAWEELKPCLVCDEVCPYDAVEFLVITDYRGTQRRPIVHKEKCIGCGMCENACPVQEPRAIVVDITGEERLREGSYITPAKRRARVVQDDRDTDYLREYRMDAATEPDSSAVKDSSKALPAEPLPPGFIFD